METHIFWLLVHLCVIHLRTSLIYHSIAGFSPPLNVANVMFLRLRYESMVWLSARSTKRHQQNNKSNFYWCSSAFLIEQIHWIVRYCIVMLIVNVHLNAVHSCRGRATQFPQSLYRNVHLFWLNASNHFNLHYNLFSKFPYPSLPIHGNRSHFSCTDALPIVCWIIVITLVLLTYT